MTEVSQGVLGTLGIDGAKFAAQLFNFAIVVFVLWRWMFKPLLGTMDERSKEIEDGLKNAQDAKLRLADAQLEKDRVLKEARAEGRGVVDAAAEKAEALRQDKMRQTKEEIEKIIDETKLQIKNERDATFGALKNELGELVTLAIGKVVGHFKEEDHRKLIEQSLKELESVK
jgi:F-type H+-transporting ATPase subunit b